MTMMELHKIAPLPWQIADLGYTWAIRTADGNGITTTDSNMVATAIVEAVNAHYGEGNDKPVVPAAPGEITKSPLSPAR